LLLDGTEIEKPGVVVGPLGRSKVLPSMLVVLGCSFGSSNASA
jgi:hypothetical protein